MSVTWMGDTGFKLAEYLGEVTGMGQSLSGADLQIVWIKKSIALQTRVGYTKLASVNGGTLRAATRASIE